MTGDLPSPRRGAPARDAALKATLAAAIDQIRAGRLEEAVRTLEADGGAALKTAVGQNIRGDIFLKQGKNSEALKAFDTAIRLAPSAAEGYCNRGVALQQLHRLDEALAAEDRAIRQRADYATAHFNRGNVLRALGRHADAVAAYTTALRSQPRLAAALLNRGVELRALNRPLDALADFSRALAVQPDLSDAHIARAGSYWDLGQPREAEAAVAAALALARTPDDLALAHYNIALLRLGAGDWKNGWADHEWRLKMPKHFHNTYAKLAPQWQGEPIAGKRLLLYAEQGHGNTFQFIRYLRLMDSAAAITVAAREPVRPLLAANFPGVEIADPAAIHGRFDHQASLMSLPAIFGTMPDTVPHNVPYLTADAERVAKWRQRLGNQGFRVGIVWQGNPDYESDRERSIQLARYAPLAEVPGVRLISVQAMVGLEQLDALPPGMKVERLGDEIEHNVDGFREAAAVMANLDLLIMSDTGPTHLAGALGRPVWMATSRNPEWRWMHDREDTPWYPTMRLFRQTTTGDWTGVFARMATALAGMVATGG